MQAFRGKGQDQALHLVPFEIRRRGELKDIEVASVLLLPPGIRAGILVVTLNNTSEMDLEIPVQFATSGGLDKVEFLGFAMAKGEKTRDMFARVPRLETSHQGLRRFYHALHTRNSAFRNKHLTKSLIKSVTRRCHA